MPLQATSGAATYDAFGGGVAVVPTYIEDVFSTYLYSGDNGTQTIANSIDLSGKGGLVWIKNRTNGTNNVLVDTIRGRFSGLYSNLTNGADGNGLNGGNFLSNGFEATYFSSGNNINNSGSNYVSWTFRKQPKFFDVVTWTGNGVDNRSISHNLGSVPSFVIVKDINSATNWYTFHRSQNNASPGPQGYIRLNGAGTVQDAPDVYVDLVNSTSSTLLMGIAGLTNANGANYVAYLFAHNAGGFGATGTDNVISCGSFTTDGSGIANVNLGYEAQWVLMKQSGGSGGSWFLFDNMRGMPVQLDGGAFLRPNLSNAEVTTGVCQANSTGFYFDGNYVPGPSVSATFIYIAIRRGPMKVPTDATKVFSPIYSTASTGTALTTNFPVDMQFEGYPPGDSLNMSINDRLRGVSTTATQSTLILTTSSTAAEASPNATMTNFWDNTGFKMPGYYGGVGYISWNFRRAPSFFDEVCYTGDSSTPRSISHNLAAVPELLIIKTRSNAGNWYIYSNFTSTSFKYANFNTSLFSSRLYTDVAEGLSSQPTLTAINLDDSGRTNGSGITYVAYLFATCVGVSKVGTYTGNGTTQTIDCGFTGGARFVLIKRQDASGGWYVYDTARGMTVLTDPYLFLNSTAAETATLGSVTTVSTGFALNSTILAAINVSSATYIFLAIA